MKIYIVQGSTGEYSDHEEWLVKAFTTDIAARQFAEKCGEEYRRICIEFKNITGENTPYPGDIIHHKISPNAHDPNMHCDYTGVNYRVFECELEDK